MPSLLIKIKQSHWLKTRKPPYLGNEDIPGECLQDLRILDKGLSVWQISDDRSNLNRVITALAASGQHIQNIDYLLFDDSIVNKLALKIKETPGGTPDTFANRSWHRDLIELSGRNLSDLAHAIFYSSEMGRVLQKELARSLSSALSNKELDSALLDPKLAKKMEAVPVALPLAPRLMRMCGEIAGSSVAAWHRFWKG